MAIAAKRALRHAEASGEELIDSLSRKIAQLRRELASVAEAVEDFSGHSLADANHNAAALARELRRGGEIVARKFGQRAGNAGKVVQENPIPVIVALGTVALLSAFFFSRD